MGGKKHGDPARDHALQQRLQRARGNRVHSFEGLIKKQNPRAVDDRGRERQLFLHAERVVGDQLFPLIRQLHEFEQLLCPQRRGRAIEAVHAADKVEVFRARQAFRQGHAFRHHADLALDLDPMAFEAESENLNLTCGWSEQSGEHLERGRFPGAVGPKEAEELPGSDPQVNLIDRHQSAQTASQSFGRDGKTVHENRC